MTEHGTGTSGDAAAPANHAGGKRVLLVTSAAPTQSPFSTKEKRPPLGIGFLISTLRQAGHEVFFIDNYLQPGDFPTAGYLRENAIDFVGIYANTICFRDTLRMLRGLQHLRQTHQWGGRIIVGGPHAAVAPHTIPDWVDYVVQGEGEYAIRDIVAGRVAERLVRYPRIENLDELPMPAWDCFVNLPYQWDVSFFEDRPVFTMNTSRGCPFQCTFCSVGSVWGRRYTCFSADRIVADIEQLIRNYGAKGVYFREDNFTLDEKRLRRFCGLMIERGIRVPWVCESRVSTLTRELVALMVRAGLKGFYFGVESGAQRMLDAMHKGITVEQIENAFRWCHEFGVKAAASVVVGLPGETEADIAATQELLKRVNPTVVWPNVFVGIPDSCLYRQVLDSRAYEYIDDRGLVYLPGHNERVARYYGHGLNAGIPDAEAAHDGTNRPRVSVLMALHNAERFVRQALESLYRQTCQDFEVVIVDDGSTDRTPEILRDMKDSRTVIYKNSENKGLTKSLNIGLKLCRGEYVARMDADDISYPQRFEKQVKFLDEHPDCAALGCWCDRIDADGRKHGAYDGRPTTPEGIREGLLAGNCIAHPTAMIRKAALADVGGYDESFVLAQDHDLWLRMSERGRLYNLPEYLVGLRFWEGNITATRARRQLEYSRCAVQRALKRRKTLPSAEGRAGAPGPQRSMSSAPHAVCGAAGPQPSPVPLPQCCRAPAPDDKEPLVTIYTVTYNTERYIRYAIESVLAQDYPNIEYLIIDDGSTDNTHAIVSSYRDPRITYVHREHANFASGMNEAIRRAKGSFILGVDADDYLDPRYVRHMVEFAMRNPGYDYYYPQVLAHVNEHNQLLPSSDVYRAYADSREILRAILHRACGVIPNSPSLKRRSLYDKTGLYRELVNLEDFAWLAEHALNVRFRLVPDNPLYYYRRIAGQGNTLQHETRHRVMAECMYHMIVANDPLVFYPELARLPDPAERQRRFFRLAAEIMEKHAERHRDRSGFHFTEQADRICGKLADTDASRCRPGAGDPSPTCGRRLRIAILPDANGVSFMEPVMARLRASHEVGVVDHNDTQAVSQTLMSADVCWIEWASDLAVHLTRLPRRCRTILRLHSFEAYCSYPRRIDWGNVDDLVFVSPHIRDVLKNQVPDIEAKVRTHVIANCVDFDRFSFRDRPRGKKLAFVGALRHAKNIPLLLQCLRAICTADSGYTLHVAGEFFGHDLHRTELFYYIRHMVKELGIERNVSFCGRVENISQWLDDKDYILSTSIREGHPVNVIEGMAKGLKPVIHNFPGAAHFYRREWIFNTPGECRAAVLAPDFDRGEYRAYAAARWSVENVLPQIGALLSRDVAGGPSVAAREFSDMRPNGRMRADFQAGRGRPLCLPCTGGRPRGAVAAGAGL